MDEIKAAQILTRQCLDNLFPRQISNDFFEAFYGDEKDGHFDIRLSFEGARGNKYYFSFELIQRPGKCLACNMTYGLPHVFARHPVINIKGLAEDIASVLDIDKSRVKWTLGSTSTQSSTLHKIPLTISGPALQS